MNQLKSRNYGKGFNYSLISSFSPPSTSYRLHDLMNEIEILNLEDKLKIFPMYVLEIQNNNLTSRQYATQFLLQKDDAIEYLSQEISVVSRSIPS